MHQPALSINEQQSLGLQLIWCFGSQATGNSHKPAVGCHHSTP